MITTKLVSNESIKSIRIYYVIDIVLRPLALVLYEYSNQFHTTCGTRPGNLRARISLGVPWMRRDKTDAICCGTSGFKIFTVFVNLINLFMGILLGIDFQNEHVIYLCVSIYR